MGLRSKSKFSENHLLAAVHNNILARKIEEDIGEPKPNDDDYFHMEGKWENVHRSLIISSYITSFAAVEAHIHGFADTILESIRIDSQFEDDKYQKGDVIDPNTEQNIYNFLDEDDGDFYWKSTLQKYQIILDEADCEPFDESENPYHDMDNVRKLRNYFAHHEPEWVEVKNNDETPDSEIEEWLKSKDVETIPWYNSNWQAYFPEGTTSIDSSIKVIRISAHFIEGFHDKLGTKEEYYPDFTNKIEDHLSSKWDMFF